ncbi:uncharacterized protein METZ01_LOCUS504030 [marine metagenome]|uniref:Uncharacterized protein n=1 Tax=marine metagenome TaxID=408172 RepID=A0A383E308_9ZZZZ
MGTKLVQLRDKDLLELPLGQMW